MIKKEKNKPKKSQKGPSLHLKPALPLTHSAHLGTPTGSTAPPASLAGRRSPREGAEAEEAHARGPSLSPVGVEDDNEGEIVLDPSNFYYNSWVDFLDRVWGDHGASSPSPEVREATVRWRKRWRLGGRWR